MDSNIKRVILDFEKERKEDMWFVQNDQGLSTIRIYIKNNGVSVSIVESSVTFTFTKADGNIVQQDITNGVNIVDAKNGIIDCTLKGQTLSYPGIVNTRVTFVQEDSRLSTTSFNFTVQKNEISGAVLSESVIPVIDGLVETVNGLIETGIQGLQGERGIQGETGERGLQGIQGLQGDKGEPGIQGVKGDTGLQGIQGIKGDTGEQGDKGVEGDKGDKGDIGERGAKGDTGLQGVQGVQGIQGETGETYDDTEILAKVDNNTSSLANNAKKLTNNWVDVVQDFGADPTGVIDSTIALQNAFNSAKDGGIYFPKGTYLTSSALNVICPVRVEFATQTTTIKFTGTGDAIRIFNQKHLIWDRGLIDISNSTDPNAVAIHIAGLWNGIFTAPATKKNGTNHIGILLESSKLGTHFGAFVNRIQDYEATGLGLADILVRKSADETTGAITHLTLDGGLTFGGTYGLYLTSAGSTFIRGISFEGNVAKTGAGIYIALCSTTYIEQLGEVTNYAHKITVDGVSSGTYIIGDNITGNNNDVNLINGGTALQLDNFKLKLNPRDKYTCEVHCDYNSLKPFSVQVQGGADVLETIMQWSSSGGLGFSGGKYSNPIMFTQPITLTPYMASLATNNSLFVDSGDFKLKFKDNTGVVKIISMT